MNKQIYSYKGWAITVYWFRPSYCGHAEKGGLSFRVDDCDGVNHVLRKAKKRIDRGMFRTA